MIMKFSKIAVLSATLVFGLLGTGCVHTIDLPQGTPMTQTKVSKVKVGMTKNQVLYVLGSPALKDALSPNRWDYLYDYKAGTDGRRAGKQDIKNASQYLSIYFDNNGLVVRIDGLQTLPVR